MTDADTQGPEDVEDLGDADDLGNADPITGVPAGRTDLDDTGTDDPEDGPDPLAVRAESMNTVTNDAVAGDTVLPGPGDGNDGPTGGAPAELEPNLPRNDLAGQDIDLDDER